MNKMKWNNEINWINSLINGNVYIIAVFDRLWQHQSHPEWSEQLLEVSCYCGYLHPDWCTKCFESNQQDSWIKYVYKPYINCDHIDVFI
jgi:hypothetical protein